MLAQSAMIVVFVLSEKISLGTLISNGEDSLRTLVYMMNTHNVPQ